ncbi:MAG TPA: transcription elongation factor Spt5 [Thermoproteales archaeon]|nr:transcription elongation factor Spt5 [Thermoproteales archaeon]
MVEKPAGGKERPLHAVRTVVGQEYNMALLIESRVKSLKLPVYSILVVDGLRGVIFIEALTPMVVDRVIRGLKYVRGRIPGTVKYSDLEKFIKPKPLIEEIEVDDIVEIIRGPLRGMRGRVVRINKVRGEVVVELFEAAYPLPTTVDAEDLRIIEKASAKSEE